MEKSAFYSTGIPVEFHQNSSGFQWNSTDFFSRGTASCMYFKIKKATNNLLSGNGNSRGVNTWIQDFACPICHDVAV